MLNHRREIDGLRAVAVVPVVLFHAGLSSGGFVGVDVFFVISGYLITSIIVGEMEAGAFSIVRFYERRARRILPALLLVLLACLPLAWAVLPPPDTIDFARSLVAVVGFVSNILFYKTSGYFNAGAELRPLLHTWSLAVEEQYYVLFPAFVVLAWRFGRRWLVAALAAVAVASFTLAQWTSAAHPTFGFFLLPTRGWEILTGALLVFLPESNPSRAWREVAVTGGLLLIAVAVAVFDATTPNPGAYTLVPAAGAALIIVFASPQTTAGRLLGSAPLAGIGLVSYSAYLWHQPLFAFARHAVPGAPIPLFVALAFVAFGLAYLTWRLVETPFRDRRRFTRGQVFAGGAAFSAALAMAGAVASFNYGYHRWLSADERQIASYVDYDPRGLYREGVCSLTSAQSYEAFAPACRPATAGVLIWGDSHAAALAAGMRATLGIVAQLTADACPPAIGTEIGGPVCRAINDFVLREVARTAPRALYLDAKWNGYGDVTGGVRAAITAIHAASPSTEVVIVGSVPQWLPSLPAVMLDKGVGLGPAEYVTVAAFADLEAIDGGLRAVAAETHARFFSALAALCHADKCRATTLFDGKPTLTAWDYGHLTAGGSTLLAGLLAAGLR